MTAKTARAPQTNRHHPVSPDDPSFVHCLPGGQEEKRKVMEQSDHFCTVTYIGRICFLLTSREQTTARSVERG